MPTPRVIDLSHWNWIPESLHATADAGIWGMIHKITEGTSTIDDKFPARFYLAREVGMLVGGYHFLRPGDMQRQADFFLERLTGYMDEHTLLACDYEDSRCSLKDVRIFMSRVEERAQRECVLYSGHVLKEAVDGGQDPGYLVDRPLWLAQYTSAAQPDLPHGWDSWWLWQYTDRGTVAGVDPPTDLNEYAGTDRASLADEWSGGSGEVQPPAPTAETLIEVTTTSDVVVAVNGKIVYP